jgi:hypothetical protein
MSAVDFIVTIHALERIAERFPELVADMSDQEKGELIHREAVAAIHAGRQGNVAPLELASRGGRWTSLPKDSYIVWNEDRMRGYVIQESEEEGTLVITVLKGGMREEKKSVLRRPLGM